MNAPSSSVLGFDFGTKRIGVAVGQTITCTANPLATVRASDGRPDWSAINALIDVWTPAAIVVGMPVNMDGSEHISRQRRCGSRANSRAVLACRFIRWTSDCRLTRPVPGSRRGSAVRWMRSRHK